MSILTEIFFALWFFLPAGIANMMPVFASRWSLVNRWNSPMDFGLSFRGKRIFGDHKTWRGLITGILFATLVLWLQQLAVVHSALLADLTSYVNYAELPVLLVGPLFGIGALLGDAVESFFKRQIGIAPGERWFPFDQTDYIIGGSIATWAFVPLSIAQYALLILIWFCLHVIATTVGYFIGVKDSPL